MGAFDSLPYGLPRWSEPHFKGSKAEARAEREDKKEERKTYAERNMARCRKREGYACRFPRCGCHVKRTYPQAAHFEAHRGAGGDPSMVRSDIRALIAVCPSRHKESRVSIDAKTLRVVPLDDRVGANGAVRWLVDVTAITTPKARRLSGDEQWAVLATESRPGVLEPLTKDQAAWLEQIAELAA